MYVEMTNDKMLKCILETYTLFPNNCKNVDCNVLIVNILAEIDSMLLQKHINRESTFLF